MYAVIIIIFIVSLFSKRNSYKKKEYFFHDDRVEEANSKLKKITKTMYYKDIKDIDKVQYLLERAFKIGSIKIYSKAIFNQKRIFINSVANVDKVYQEVRNKIELYRRNSSN